MGLGSASQGGGPGAEFLRAAQEQAEGTWGCPGAPRERWAGRAAKASGANLMCVGVLILTGQGSQYTLARTDGVQAAMAKGTQPLPRGIEHVPWD